MNLAPDDPLTFAEAAEIILRGLVKAATLRAAADRGELRFERLGRRLVTTPAAVHEWRESCRAAQKVPAYTSASVRVEKRSGSSETDRAKSAQTHALMMADEL